MGYVGVKRIVLSGSVIVFGDEETLIDEQSSASLTLRFNQEEQNHPAGYRDGMPQHLLLEMPKVRPPSGLLQTMFAEEMHEVRVAVQWLNDLHKVVFYTVLER